MERIYSSLVKAQSEFKEVKKNAKADIGKFSYTYMTLDALIETVRPALGKYGLGIIQNIITGENNKMSLTTKIIHESGESIENNCPILGNIADMQKLGSGITYARRYGLQSILGIFAEEDDDGAMTKGSANQSKQQAPSNNYQNAPKQEFKQNTNKKPSEAQMKRLYAIRKSSGMNDDEFEDRLQKANITLDTMNVAQYNAVVNVLQERANEKVEQQKQETVKDVNFTVDDIPFE